MPIQPAPFETTKGNEMEISLRDLLAECGAEPQVSSTEPWVIGKHYLIRTVTMTQVGRLKFVGPQELVLSDAAWIADTGRFHDCLKDPSSINEAEPFVNDAIVGRGSICDATEWHSEKVSQK